MSERAADSRDGHYARMFRQQFWFDELFKEEEKEACFAYYCSL